MIKYIYYASSSNGEAYCNHQLTPNFELWIDFFFFACRRVSIRGFQNRVFQFPDKWNHSCFVNISHTVVIDTSMERSSRVLEHGNTKIWFSFQKRSKWNFDVCWNHPWFVNIRRPTLVNGTSMERSSRVLQHGIKKKYIFWNKYSTVFLPLCVGNNSLLILCTLIGTIMLSINIQVGLNIYPC